MRTPVPSSARASTIAVGWIKPPSATALPFELPYALLERPHLADEVGKHGLGRPDAAPLGHGPARNAAPDLARRHVVRHPRLRGEHGALAHRHVIGQPDLP